MRKAHADEKNKSQPDLEAGTLAEPLLSSAESALHVSGPEYQKKLTKSRTISSFGSSLFAQPQLRNGSTATWSSTVSMSDFKRPFHQNRWQVLSGEEKFKDLLEPFARLYLHVREARRVLPFDVLGRSDPYFKLYLNDVVVWTSPVANFTLHPKWDCRVMLDVYSPFDMVRILLLDYDRFNSDDPMGFLEFRVGELIPGDPELSGWFEIRMMDKFVWDGVRRFKAHRARRDDENPYHQPNASRERSDDLQRQTSAVSLTSERRFDYAVSANQRRSVKNTPKFRCLGLGTLCPSAGFKEADDRQRLNGGHFFLSMRVKLIHTPEQPPAPLPPMWRILAGALVNDLEYLALEDEWYACCLPRPVSEPVEKSWQGVEVGRENLNLLQMRDMSRTAMKVKRQISDNILKPMISLALYIINWRAWPLSLSVLIFWLVVAVFPGMFLPCLPLYLAMWLFLFRRPQWTNAMFTHSDLAPLNGIGLEMVASLGNPRKMMSWLKRLVEDHGGWVSEPSALLQLAKLLAYGHNDGMEGLPSFPELLVELHDQWYIDWGVAQRKKCPHCLRSGSEGLLELWGSGAYRPDNDGWCCHYGPRLCLHTLTDKGRKLGRRRASFKGLHLGVVRYHCSECENDYCGDCVAAEQGAIIGTVMSIPLLGSAFERMQDSLVRMVASVEDMGATAEVVLHLAEKLTRADEKHLARRLYLACFAASVSSVVAFFRFRQNYAIAVALEVFWKTLLALMGMLLMLQKAGPLRRARTAYLATHEYRKLQGLREDGGCNNWMFFTTFFP